MRDKNLSPQQFNIQLEKYILRKLRNENFLRTPVSDSPKCFDENWIFSYPKDFRSLRALAISHWYFPEYLFWKVHLELIENDFRFLSTKQKIEISIYLDSEEIMKLYLYETKRFSSRELFGNILGNELEVLLKHLSLKEIRKKPPVRVQRHRGYRDKGTLRVAHHWLPDYDYSLTEYQNYVEQKRTFTVKIISSLLQKLRNILNTQENFSEEGSSSPTGPKKKSG